MVSFGTWDESSSIFVKKKKVFTFDTAVTFFQRQLQQVLGQRFVQCACSAIQMYVESPARQRHSRKRTLEVSRVLSAPLRLRVGVDVVKSTLVKEQRGLKAHSEAQRGQVGGTGRDVPG